MTQDTRLFRQALWIAGFGREGGVAPSVFNDKHKSGETRRLKLWFGDHVFNAPQAQQEKLDALLAEKFGHRYLGGQFVERFNWWSTGTKSFCVYLLTV